MAKGKGPSEKEVLKARKAKVLKRIVQDLQSFSVEEAWLDYVVFRYAGHYIRFEYYEGNIVRMGGDNVHLTLNDYLEMYKLSKMLMKATQAAIKAMQKKRAQVAKKAPAADTSPILFDALHVQLNPHKKPKKKRK